MKFVKRILIVSLLNVCLAAGTAFAQGVPQVGERTDLADVTIYISEPNRRAMQQEVEKLYVNRSLVAAKVEQMGMYFPLVEPVLAQEGVPDDFKFLVLEDSTLAANQRSVGLWNITRTNPLGLRVSPVVDERLHLLASTEAAVAHLKALYRQTGNWLVALHLYGRPVGTASEGPARNAEEKSNYALTQPNDELVMRLLAHKLVLERAFPAYRPQRPLVLYPYSANTKEKTLAQLADFFRVNQQDVIRLNPWLKGQRVPYDKEYTVFIPAPLEQFTEVKRRAGVTEGSATSWQDLGFPVLRKLNESKSSSEPVFYTINGKKGIQAQLYDNEITLAYRGKIKVEDFLRYNDMNENQPVYSGEVYYLERKEKLAKVPYHVVKKGQSLWDVAQQYGIQMSYLLKYNEISPEQRATPGRILWMQKKRPKDTPVEYYRQPEMKRSAPSRQDTAVVIVKIAMPEDQPATRSLLDSIAGLAKAPVPRKADTPPAAVPSSSGNATKTVKSAPVVPADEVPVAAKESRPPAEKPANSPLVIHTVEKGETFPIIAKRYGISVAQIYTWNKISTVEKYPKIGQQLMIETAGRPITASTVSAARPATPSGVAPAPKPAPSGVTPAPKPAPVEKPTAPAAEPLIHIVKPGENLYRIGLRYKVAPAQVIKWNSITNKTVSPGQRLLIWK